MSDSQSDVLFEFTAIGRWGSSAPEANRTSRQDFQDNVIQPAINGVLIDGWSFEPRSGVYAEKIITGTCGWGVRRSAVAHQRAAVVVFHYRYQ